MSNTLPLAGGSLLAPALTLTGVPQAGVAGKGYFFRPSPAGGQANAPLSYSLSGTLPDGLTFSSHSGTIRGSALSPGVTQGLAITVTDGFTSATLPNLQIVMSAGLKPLSYLRNDMIDTIGDSRTQQAFQSARDSLEGQGPYAFAWPASNYKFRFVSYKTLAQSGNNTSQVLDLLPTVIARGAGTIVFWTGAADYATGLTLQQTKDNITAMIKLCLNAGIMCVFADESPRVGGFVQQYLDTHAWLSTLSSVFPNVRMWNMWDLVLDPATGAGGSGLYNPKAGYTKDGTHETEQMSKPIGESLGATLSSLMTEFGFGSVDYLRAWTPGDPVYGATFPVLNVNPAMSGTTGVRGAGITGAFLGDGYGVTRGAAGVSVVVSQETIGGILYNVFTISGTSASPNQLSFYDNAMFTAPPFLAEGKSFDTAANIILNPGSSGVQTVYLESAVTGPTLVSSRIMSNETVATNNVATPDGYSYPLLTPPALITTGATQTIGRLIVKFVPGATVSAVVKVGRFRMREVR